ncbi:hypothetical protein QEV68_10690 [Trueperella pyogenes]|uniref:hypothetical protein n=1 Tax=Trueperella pyogenes TaxID=1661 RepID=UPI00324B6D9A
MSRLFTLKQASERTHFSVGALRKAIRQNYAPGEPRLPYLAAKKGRARGTGSEYLIPEDALNDFINQLPDA